MARQMVGDFISFTFNNNDSSSLGIIRVSDGDRYNQNLSPEFEDKTVEIPGGDGTYYFNSNFSQLTFPLSIAFDSLTEKEVRRLYQVFNGKERGELIFFETPYKKYQVKVSEVPEISYICFEENGQRTYKGEGEIEFVGYNPYAKSTHKFLNEFSFIEEKNTPSIFTLADGELLEDYIYFRKTSSGNTNIFTPVKYEEESEIEYYEGWNLNEWAESSGMLYENNDEYDTFSTAEGGQIATLYNPGDIEADWKLAIPFDSNIISGESITISQDGNNLLQINFSDIIKQGNDTGILINTATKLIQGYNGNINKVNNNLYNQFICSGDFFKIPISRNTEDTYTMTVTTGDNLNISYDYLYF